jgi:hypothetical protein
VGRIKSKSTHLKKLKKKPLDSSSGREFHTMAKLREAINRDVAALASRGYNRNGKKRKRQPSQLPARRLLSP